MGLASLLCLTWAVMILLFLSIEQFFCTLILSFIILVHKAMLVEKGVKSKKNFNNGPPQYWGEMRLTNDHIVKLKRDL